MKKFGEMEFGEKVMAALKAAGMADAMIFGECGINNDGTASHVFGYNVHEFGAGRNFKINLLSGAHSGLKVSDMNAMGVTKECHSLYETVTALKNGKVLFPF